MKTLRGDPLVTMASLDCGLNRIPPSKSCIDVMLCIFRLLRVHPIKKFTNSCTNSSERVCTFTGLQSQHLGTSEKKKQQQQTMAYKGMLLILYFCHFKIVIIFTHTCTVYL